MALSAAVALLFLLLAAAFFASWAQAMLRNYAAARTIGVPIRIIPICPFNPLWALVDRKAVALLRRLPLVGNNTFTRYNWRGWDLEDRWKSHAEMGDAFVMVTPSHNLLFLGEPEAAMSVYKRPVDFPRPVFISEALKVFGPNISCSEGQSWRTQRRVATRCFNEANNEIVWSETLGLADDMLRYWTAKGSVKSVAEDIRSVTLSVLARAGFGKSTKFRGHDERVQLKETDSQDERESLALVLENCLIILALGPKTLSSLARWWLPSKLRVVNNAVESFQAQMTLTYEEEKRAFAAGEQRSRNTLMTLLIRASQEAAEEEGDAGGGLTESEIYGNMFTFNFAGHDTTAHSSTFALYFLAAHPDIQEWIGEEIQAVLAGREPHEMDYRADFPRFKRCLAVLYEALRLYTIVPVVRWTGDRTTTLQVNGKTLHLPAKTMVSPNHNSLQTDPRYWGNDSLDFRPSRWIRCGKEAGNGTPGREEMETHQRGSFAGWSEGTRDCPGRKFAQVEFVAMLVGLFREWRVEPARQEGETLPEARQRVKDLISEDTAWGLLLQMMHPERAPLAWRKA